MKPKPPRIRTSIRSSSLVGVTEPATAAGCGNAHGPRRRAPRCSTQLTTLSPTPRLRAHSIRMEGGSGCASHTATPDRRIAESERSVAMMRISLAAGPVAVLVLVLAGVSPAPAHAQTRTWVSGVGDDANPCSRIAPCKTFAGAISKTAAGGEINALDPGGFGQVTISKSITIDGTGVLAGILAAYGDGIIVNSRETTNLISVRLRGLAINGVGTGVNGINVIAANKVVIEDCV